CASRNALEQLQSTYFVVPSVLAAPDQREGGRKAHASPTGRPLHQTTSSKAQILAFVRERVRGCTKCAHLASSRTQTVFGVGNPDAEIMFIGEAPGADEDQQG